jgi:hypothetical protein
MLFFTSRNVFLFSLKLQSKGESNRQLTWVQTAAMKAAVAVAVLLTTAARRTQAVSNGTVHPPSGRKWEERVQKTGCCYDVIIPPSPYILAVLRRSFLGHTFECNPSGNFGCSGWEKGDRMKCLEEPPDGSTGHRGCVLRPWLPSCSCTALGLNMHALVSSVSPTLYLLL